MIFDKKIKRIHLIGIGGISMSAIAKYLHLKGYIVSGSDRYKNKQTDLLEKLSISIQYNHNVDLVKKANLIIYSQAINKNNDELVYAKNNNIKMIVRNKFMNILTKSYHNSICVLGTHGKTTTTSILTLLLKDTDLKPTAFVGTHLKGIDSNFLYNDGNTIINETCEYKDSHLDFDSNISIITNIDLDHVDYFKDINQLKNSFIKYINNMREDSFVLINEDDSNSKSIKEKIKKNIITFAIDSYADYTAKNIEYNKDYTFYELFYKGDFLIKVKQSLIGKYNIYNSLSALSVVNEMGLLNTKIVKLLENIEIGGRRFEYKNTFNNSLMYDDYAHHPSEIKALIKGVKERFKDKKIVVAFEPHTFSRTYNFLDDFSNSFYGVYLLYILPIYPAREENIYDISSNDLINLLIKKGINTKYVNTYKELLVNLKSILDSSTIFITVGAGSITDFHKLY